MPHTPPARLVDITEAIHGKKVLIVGDLHGCKDELDDILAMAVGYGFRVGEDCIVSTGDLCDRGPKIVECFDFFMNTPNTYVVNSNHEDKFLRYLMGNPVQLHTLAATIEQFKDRLMDREYYEKLVAFVRGLPEVIKFRDCVVAHAGLSPAMPLDTQDVNTCLRSRVTPVDPIWKETAFFGHEVKESWASPLSDKVFMLDAGCVFGNKLRACLVEHSLGGSSMMVMEVMARDNHYKNYLKAHHSKMTLPVQVFLDAHASVESSYSQVSVRAL